MNMFGFTLDRTKESVSNAVQEVKSSSLKLPFKCKFAFGFVVLMPTLHVGVILNHSLSLGP